VIAYIVWQIRCFGSSGGPPQSAMLAGAILPRLLTVTTLLISLALGFGCATVPRESVELSTTVGRDVAEVHRAHRELAVQYFKRLVGDINTFIDEVYRPYTIKQAIEDFELLTKIQEASQPGASLDVLDVLRVFVEEVAREIEEFRRELLGPVEIQRDEALASLDAAYLQIQNANSIVTGHLASVRKVQDVQDELLKKVNLSDLRRRFIEGTVALSDQVHDLVERARTREESVESIEMKLKKLLEKAAPQPQ